jgi:hypothetical protein
MPEAISCPTETEDNNLIESDRLNSCDQLAKVSNEDEGMARQKSETAGFRSGGLGSFMEPTHRELQKARIEVGRAVHGHRKLETRAYHLSKSLGRMLEQSWNADNLHHFFI